jgi:putative FmdB family regulatory protein
MNSPPEGGCGHRNRTMPLYEYQCESCQHRFEVIQKFSDAPVDTCPKCSGVVKRLLSSPAIQFKGSGWYITDYARKSSGDSSKTAKAGEGDSSAASTDSAASKTETKTDTKAETKTESNPSPTKPS